MNPTPRLLALFTASLAFPDTRAQTMDEVGSPKDVTRFAHTRDEDGMLMVVTDTVNGPKRDDAMETISASVLVDGNAMLVTMQDAPDKVGAISTDEYDALAKGYATYLEQDQDVQLSAKGDPELDGNTKVMFFVKSNDDAPYTATDVSDKVGDYIVDGDMAFIYADGQGAQIATATLLENLKLGNEITHGAAKIIAIGREKKLARGPKIDVGGQKVSTWAYVGKNDDGEMEMVILAKNTLDEVTKKGFDGKYATADRMGDEILIVLHVVADADIADEPEQRLDDADIKADDADEPDEKFELSRVPTEKFFAAAA